MTYWPAIPQFNEPDVPAKLGGRQTQYVAEDEISAASAAKVAVANYQSNDPPAGVWYPDPTSGDLEWHPVTDFES
jgi:hypothetical protein